jgi:hypothetical protein
MTYKSDIAFLLPCFAQAFNNCMKKNDDKISPGANDPLEIKLNNIIEKTRVENEALKKILKGMEKLSQKKSIKNQNKNKQ